ncbi:hypothetical protein BGP77_14985 [Saccharospirillum sp. MSK14-1]|nr:hypothetical protein BGP77_14985 [Saccharospirillum sp. MSK14-1]
MGIESWYPRMRLPMAPEPLLFDLDDSGYSAPAAEQASATQQPQPTPGQSAQSPAPAQPAESTAVPRIQAVPPKAEAEPQAAPKAQSAPAVPRFVLSLSVVGPYLIADTLARGLEQPTAAGQQLLLNILATLGVSAKDVHTHHVIQWPLFTNPRVDQGIQQAQLYVDEKLEQFVRQHEPKQLLSFGAVLPRLHDWQQPHGEHLGLPWVGLPSLYRMLDDPRQKAVAWQRLKPLVTAATPDNA